MKTKYEMLKEMVTPEARMAMEDLEKDTAAASNCCFNPDDANGYRKDPYGSIACLFSWKQSPQGEAFWKIQANKLLGKKWPVCEDDKTEPKHDDVNHPKHYTGHPSGIECITITRHMSFNLGNVVKYLWRAGKKDPAKELEDLKKARFYLDDEIRKLEGGGGHG